jgi:replicative superfamily II helicase
MEINQWLKESLDTNRLEEAKEIVNKRKLAKYFPYISDEKDNNNNLLMEVLDSLEFLAIDLWNSKNIEERERFVKICNEYFEIAQALPISDIDVDRIKHVLRLITYGYLGEKWEAARRFLIENEIKLKVELSTDNGNWNERLFKSIYMSIFYLVKKQSWEDLTKATFLINKLREEQKEYEEKFLENTDNKFKQASALELASLYHLAKCVEIVGQFQGSGVPNDVIDQLKYHFEHAIRYAEMSGNIELNLILQMLQATFEKMIFNSIWMVAKKVNSRVTKFVDIITKSNKPIIELLYPQRDAIIEKGLLDPAHKAIVVNLPTSSGKTIIAEFRILQALNQFADEKGWVAYVVPTRALVNQISARLRQDLGKQPLGIKIEKISGALEMDAYEENVLAAKINFDILVTTPEKLNLMIRQGIENKINRPLALVVVDEAHNLESEKRGLNLEMLLSMIKKDCARANFLLLTPFVPNSDEIAEWLDSQSSKSIGIELNWQPNDRVIGMFYAEGGQKNIKTFYKTLLTSNETINFNADILIDDKNNQNLTISKLNNKSLLTSVVASQLAGQDGILVISRTVKDTYSIAENIFNNCPEIKETSEINLVKKFIASEMGSEFPLVRYLDKGIGIHHSGLSDEIRYLMEMLMEKGSLKYLVATTTIAQGINFPVSTILMASYSYPYTPAMPVRDFWNLVGRAGRIYQKSLGVVGIAVKGGKNSNDATKLIAYLQQATERLVSVLVNMVDKTLIAGGELNLEKLYYKPEWSMFLQYIAHMYKQSQDLNNFIADIEMTMRRTYGYNQLSEDKKHILLKSVKEYAQKLDKNKHLATLSDATGFSPETIQSTISKVRGAGIRNEDWTGSSLFSSDPKTLQKLVGIMLNAPEIKTQLNEIKIGGSTITNSTLARLISDWVTGKEIPDMARNYFGGEDCNSISNCVNAIYSKLVYSATWGLAALQKMPGSGLDFDKLTDDEKRKLSNLPAMIYYGVNTDEAVLLRKVNIPRAIAHQLGQKLRDDFGADFSVKSTSDVSDWLNNLDNNEWQKAIPSGKTISGEDYKNVWKILSGVE